MLQAQIYVCDKNVLAVLRIHIFLSPSSSLVSCELFVWRRPEEEREQDREERRQKEGSIKSKIK